MSSRSPDGPTKHRRSRRVSREGNEDEDPSRKSHISDREISIAPHSSRETTFAFCCLLSLLVRASPLPLNATMMTARLRLSLSHLGRRHVPSPMVLRPLSAGRGAGGGDGPYGKKDAVAATAVAAAGGESGTAAAAVAATPAAAASDRYVHPLSQIVLERLQSCHGGWMASSGAHRSLELHDDGTFSLRFPPDDGGKDEGKGEGGAGVGDAQRTRIWTSYDPEERKHWLAVQRGVLAGRYVLQDNKRPAWHSDRKSVPEKVQDAVDAMIRKLEE